MNSERREVNFENLDGLRFIAFLLVFLFHGFGFLLPQTDQGTCRIIGSLLTFHFQSGNFGVSFFFVLSGFLISYLLFHDCKTRGNFSLKNFYLRRILRIWPLYFVVTILGFFIFPLFFRMVGADPNTNATLFRYLGFMANFDIIQRNSFPSPVLGVMWTLAIEEQFYLFWPIVLLLVPRRFVPAALALFIMGSLAYRYSATSPTADRHSLSAVVYLAGGCLLAYASAFSAKFIETLRCLPRAIIFGGYLAGIIFLFIDQMISYHLRHINALAGADAVYQVVRLVLLTLFFSFVIGEQNYSERSLFKIGHFRRISLLGKYTYGLYLLHMIPILIFKYVPLDFVTATGECLLRITISFVCTLVLGYLSYTFFERQFLNLKKKLCRPA